MPPDGAFFANGEMLKGHAGVVSPARWLLFGKDGYAPIKPSVPHEMHRPESILQDLCDLRSRIMPQIT
jgi:hypothetical protein